MGRLYVGNLSDDVSSESLKTRFAEFGVVVGVEIAMDRASGRMRGHAFVTMGTDAEARNAASRLDGQLFEDRPLRVSLAGEAREPTKRTASTRITSQFRERHNMSYELDCVGVTMALKMFPADEHEKSWRVEMSVRSATTLEPVVKSATAPTRKAAMAELAQTWDGGAELPLDWTAINEALAAVRAI